MMMEKQKILEELAKHDNTVLSFPNRGPWGDSRYRGNCSGWIPAYFINKFNVKNMAEIFAGSGTTYDVCKDMGINYIGIDLNPNPLRDGIISMDILNDTIELPDEFYNADMLFLHPPYPSIHDVRYSNSMWKDTTGVASRDIQNMTWEQGMMAVNHAVLRGYNALPAGAYEVVLVGEIRSKGSYRSMMQNLAIPGILHQTYVKLQHNTVSGRKSYGNMRSDFAMTGHEMIAVIKKPSGFELAYVIPQTYRMDIRDSQMSTWKDVVMAVVRNLGKETFSNQEVYESLEMHKKARNNPNWKAKVRQTMQKLTASGLLVDAGYGTWAVAAA